MPWDIPALLAGFTDDCAVRFGDLPESFAARLPSKNCSAAAASGKRTIDCAKSFAR
jgi:hypothetical protein